MIAALWLRETGIKRPRSWKRHRFASANHVISDRRASGRRRATRQQRHRAATPRGSVWWLVAWAVRVEVLVVLPDRGHVFGRCPLQPLELGVIALIAEQAAFAPPTPRPPRPAEQEPRTYAHLCTPNSRVHRSS